jgi:hypothetical protein
MNKESMVVKAIITLVGIALLLPGAGCSSVVKKEYRSHVQQLDGKNELVISTYPAWFPTEEAEVPPLNVKVVSDDYVALQFLIREQGTDSGSSPHIESIQVNRLAYRLDDGPENVILRNFPAGFWMQETGNHSERKTKGIPYQNGSVLHVSVDLTLNGEKYLIQGKMPARRRVSRYPIIGQNFGR